MEKSLTPFLLYHVTNVLPTDMYKKEKENFQK